MAKKASLDNLLLQCNPDIIAISETWLKPEILSSEFLSTDYIIFRRDRPDGYGGVLIACWNSLNCHCPDINSETEAIACHITLANHQTLCAFYRPPNRQPDSVTNLCTSSEALSVLTLLHLFGLLVTLNTLLVYVMLFLTLLKNMVLLKQ